MSKASKAIKPALDRGTSKEAQRGKTEGHTTAPLVEKALASVAKKSGAEKPRK